ncbi:3-oxoacyl-[acyl-carrier-protein] synthase I, chloroplastic-like protein [Tanacetum coccineum]
MTSSMVMRVDDVINGDESRSRPNTMKPMTRCLIVASMIGSSGLLGNLWPDLDMLPLGWLSEADGQNTNWSSSGVCNRHRFNGPKQFHFNIMCNRKLLFFNAANHIIRGDADVMIAGGTEAAANAIGVGGFIACRALS